MAVNDFCRLCEVNLRINGTITGSKLIFDRMKEENVCSQLSNLGLDLLNTTLCSSRVCRKCCNVISRLLRDMEIFNDWKRKETLARQKVTLADERDRDSPSETPRTLKKRRKSMELRSRSSVTEVIINYENQDKHIICQSDVSGIVENLAKRNFVRAGNLISRHRELMEGIKSNVLDIVEDECKKLCNPQHHFMMWRASAHDLQTFSFTELFEDLKRLSPFILSIIAKMSKDSLPHICTAASVALRGRDARLSALAYYVDTVLLYGGAKKAVFQRLAKLGISTNHQSAVGKQKELAQNSKRPPVFSLKRLRESLLSSQVTNRSDQEKKSTRQKLFSCHMCNTSFSTKGSLKVHMRLHTGSKPFKCPFCFLRFRTSGHRKTHIQSHIRPSDRKAKRSSGAEPQRQEVQSVPQAQHPSSAVDAQPSVGLLQTSSTDPNIYIPGNSVLTGQYDPSLLQQGLVGQAILPATVSAGGDLTVSLSEGLATLEGIHLVCPNVQISGIVPSILQQGSLLSHSLRTDSGLTAHATAHLMTDGDTSVPANVVIHPLTGLSLQPPPSAISSLTNQQENAGQDLLPHHCSSSTPNINPGIRLAPGSSGLTLSSKQLLPQSPPPSAMTVSALAPSTSLSHTSMSAQSLVMSSAGVASDGSVTLTLADTQILDTVSLNLNTQMIDQTEEKEAETKQKHQCYYCSQMLLTANALRRHCRQEHGKERCHVCRVCSKAFKRATHLKEHEYVHKKGPKVSSQKPKVFKCASCDKAFAKPSQLERHNRIQTAEVEVVLEHDSESDSQQAASQEGKETQSGLDLEEGVQESSEGWQCPIPTVFP